MFETVRRVVEGFTCGIEIHFSHNKTHHLQSDGNHEVTLLRRRFHLHWMNEQSHNEMEIGERESELSLRPDSRANRDDNSDGYHCGPQSISVLCVSVSVNSKCLKGLSER